ncbi:unnamed protein product [Heterobilharzia americana]|nr:unnamed protein product [Heterobilharzia americana]
MAKKRKKSRKSTRSSQKSERNPDDKNTATFDPQVYEAQIASLKKKTKDFQYAIDNLKDINTQLFAKAKRNELDSEGLTTYLENCIQNKDIDVNELKKNLNALCCR